MTLFFPVLIRDRLITTSVISHSNESSDYAIEEAQQRLRKTERVLVEKETESPEQANYAATALHCHVVMHGSYSLKEFQSCIVVFS